LIVGSDKSPEEGLFLFRCLAFFICVIGFLIEMAGKTGYGYLVEKLILKLKI